MRAIQRAIPLRTTRLFPAAALEAKTTLPILLAYVYLQDGANDFGSIRITYSLSLGVSDFCQRTVENEAVPADLL